MSYAQGWEKTRRRILERDGHRCTVIRSDGTRCPARATDVDHIVNRKAGGTEDDSNLRAICSWHHKQKSSAEGNRARRRVSQTREPEKHPGLR